MLPGASKTILHRDLVNLYKVVQGVLRQRCRRFFPLLFCPKSIKTRFNRIFSGALLTHSPQTILHRKIIYNFAWIYLSQRCRRKLLVQCWPIWLTMFMRKITCTMLYRPFWDNIAQENYLYSIGPERTDKWLVVCFLTKYNILNKIGSFCPKLAREFIYGFRDNNEQGSTLTGTSSQATFWKKKLSQVT